MSRDQLAQDGYTVAAGALSQHLLDEFAATLCHFIRLEAQELAPGDRARLDALGEDKLPHAGLVALRDIDPELMRRVIDRCKVSPALFNIIYSPDLANVAKTYLNLETARDVLFAYPNFRADLPDRYEDQKKYSLPWHQEAAYYKTKASESRSVVLHCTLFDCFAGSGALEVKAKSHKETLLEHKEYYMDESQKKHFRVELPDSAVKKLETMPLETRAGDVGLIDFKTFHRSGENTSDTVRYTFLIRATPANAPDLNI